MSACIAARLSTVSSKVSPLVDEDAAILRLKTSAESRFAAISKVVRVRVDGSKNRLKIDLPRSSGTFFTSRSPTPTKDAAVSRMRSMMARGSPSMVRRCCSSPASLSCGFRIREPQVEFSAFVARQAQQLPLRHRERSADVLRSDGKLALAAVDQHRELDLPRSPVIEQFVHRRAHRAPRVEHVVDHHDVPAADFERNLRRLHLVMQSSRVEIVAVERDVERAHRRLEPELPVQAFGEPGAAGAYAHQARLRADAGAQPAYQLLAEGFSVGKIHRGSPAG